MTDASTMAGISLISARVMHARLRPLRNSFRYRVPYVAVPEADLSAATDRGLFSIDRTNIFTVRTADYGDGASMGIAFVRHALQQHQLREADGQITLVTIPRVLGIGFNPVSFWLCEDKAGSLRAVLAEVNNTFGERHFYLCAHTDRRPIQPADTLTAQKVFHVSPFMKVEGHYRFAFSWTKRHFGVRIDLHDSEGLLLTTSLAGERVAATNVRLALSFLSNPLLMFKVLGLIHYQAAVLWMKGIGLHRKPAPPAELVTR